MQIPDLQAFLHGLLRLLVERKGSDLFLTAGYPPAMKVDGMVHPVSDERLTAEDTAKLAQSLMNQRQADEFAETSECNFAVHPQGVGRFRVNAFIQQGRVGVVMRTINTEIPRLEDLGLPLMLKELVMQKRGLILVVGATGSGKSTTLAALVGHRNGHSHGHIVTVEDPVEFVHQHQGCIVTQREVGVDTFTWAAALKNALRQAPDVILIGEIRDRDTMEHAVTFAETGHLCLGTLHATSTNQALDRIVNFFPEERRPQLLMDLSLNLKAILSQRLIPRKSGSGRVPAVEILINSPLIQELIFKGDIPGIRDLMKRSRELGMQTFDQALFELHEKDLITYEDAMRNADSVNDLRLQIKLHGKEGGREGLKKEAGKFQIMDR